MKKNLFAMIIFASGLCAFAIGNSPFRRPLLHGEVKNYTEINFEITTKFGDYYRTPKIKFLHEFNDEGLEIRFSEFTAVGQLVNRIEYTYNEDGNLFSQICYDSKKNTLWKIISSFDENGVKAEDCEYDDKDNLTGKTVYKNVDSNPTEETYYNSTGELVWKKIYKYSDANQLEESFSYSADGQLDIRRKHKYDKFGKLLETASFDASDKIISNEVFSYNDDDTINEYAIYGEDGKRQTRIFYKYDENKNCIKSITYKVTQKFGTVVNEMVDQSDFEYEYR